MRFVYTRRIYYKRGAESEHELGDDPIRSWQFMALEFVLYCIATLGTSQAKHLVDVVGTIQIQTSVVKR